MISGVQQWAYSNLIRGWASCPTLDVRVAFMFKVGNSCPSKSDVPHIELFFFFLQIGYFQVCQSFFLRQTPHAMGKQINYAHSALSMSNSTCDVFQCTRRNINETFSEYAPASSKVDPQNGSKCLLFGYCLTLFKAYRQCISATKNAGVGTLSVLYNLLRKRVSYLHSHIYKDIIHHVQSKTDAEIIIHASKTLLSFQK